MVLTHGIDLSHHQNPKAVPWERIAKECAFVICRATYGTHRDELVVEHAARARRAGCAVGLYHFFRASQNVDDQLAAFCAAAEAASYAVGDIAPAIDIEDDPKVSQVGPSWDAALRTLALAFEQRYGTPPILYITQRDWARLGKPSWVLWVAHYTQAKSPATPAGKPWLIWQHRVGPFEPAGSGGLYDPALYDQNQCCGDLPRITKTTTGSVAPSFLGSSSDPSWAELRARVEMSQALWFEEQLHPPQALDNS